MKNYKCGFLAVLFVGVLGRDSSFYYTIQLQNKVSENCHLIKVNAKL